MILLLFFMLHASKPGSEKILKKIEANKIKYESNDQLQRQYLSELFQIQKELKLSEKELAIANKKKNSIIDKIRSFNEEVLALDQEINDLRIIIQQRLRVTSQVIDASLKKIVVFSENPGDIERTIKGLEFLLAKDVRLVSKLTSSRNRQEELKSSMQGEIKQLTSIKQELEKKTSHLKLLHEKNNMVISKIRKDQSRLVKNLEQLRMQGSSEIGGAEEQAIEALLSKSFFEFKGQLPYPVQGKLEKRFGPYKKSDLKFYSKGVFFSSDDGTQVRSVAKGKVIFVGKMESLENVVLIEHGTHYYSLYGFIAEPQIKANQKIVQGQVLGNVGWNTFLQAKGLYFELRHFSEPMNPLDWFTDSKIQLSIDTKGDSHYENL